MSATHTFYRGDVDPVFPLRGCVLGVRGGNVRRICEATGASVSLEAGVAANPQESDASEAATDVLLRLRVSGREGAGLEEAVEMVRQLVVQVREEHERWVARGISAKVGPPAGGRRPATESGAKGFSGSGGQTAARERRRTDEETLRVYEGDLDPAFPLRGCLLGERGKNFRYICDQTRVRLTLEGGGSQRGGAAGPDPQAADVPMRLRVTGGPGADFAAAMEMVRELLRQVREDHDQWKTRRAPTGSGGSRSRPARGSGQEAAVQAAKERCLAESKRLRAEAERLTEAMRVGQSAAPKIPAATLLGACDDAAGAEGCSVAQSAAAAYSSGKAFWRALEAKLAEDSMTQRQLAAKAKSTEHQAKVLEKQMESLSTVRGAKGSGGDRMGGFCALFPLGACPFGDGDCPRGQHGEPPAPAADEVLVRITRAKRRLLQQKWADAGGSGELVSAWQVRNPRLEFLFRASECDFAAALGHSSDAIDGWHGTAEENVQAIALHGFDPRRRSGQVHGAGEYFAKDPRVSISYARGGAFMFLCKLLLGSEDRDHTWVDSCEYYVLKQRDCRIQALPLFVVQFRESQGQLVRELAAIKSRDTEDAGTLAVCQRGGLQACEARRDAGMLAASTRHLWVGWLAPELCHQDDDAVTADVEAFLEGLAVSQVVPERNGARIGAFVLLCRPISRAEFVALRRRRYRGEFRISVDDQQPENPRCAGRTCPRLTGPSQYCRGWNLRGHHAWQWGCPFEHPEAQRPTSGVEYRLEAVPRGSAKFDEIETELLRTAPFTSADGSRGRPRIVAVRRVLNGALERLYEERRGFLHDKHGFAVEKELWHGTNCKALPELLTHGLQPPSDTRPSEACPRSGGKGLCTTLCGADCPHCREPHAWDRCHMYGLGVYLADQAGKSHRYVREPRAETLPAPSGRWQTVLAGKWRDFDEGLQAELGAARLTGRTVHRFSARGWSYELDFTRMLQTNLSTGRAREVRCLEEEEEEALPQAACISSRRVYSMLRCRVCLGNPYLVEGNLLRGEAMHDMCWCQDPSDALESCAEAWGVAKGHDAYYVRGLAGAHKAGLGVYNSEYIVFQPHQILPLYQVEYVLE